MLLEFAALTGIIILALIIIIEFTRMVGLGLIVGVLFLFLAYWIYGDGIQVSIGSTISQNSTFNATTNETISSQAITAVYAPLPATPFVDMTNILAFISVLCGLYSIVHYSIDIFTMKH